MTSSLQEWGFEVDPYDWCVANKTVGGKQMTVAWHVENMKIYHKNRDTVDSLINQIKKKYGKEADLTIHRVKVN